MLYVRLTALLACTTHQSLVGPSLGCTRTVPGHCSCRFVNHRRRAPLALRSALLLGLVGRCALGLPGIVSTVCRLEAGCAISTVCHFDAGSVVSTVCRFRAGGEDVLVCVCTAYLACSASQNAPSAGNVSNSVRVSCLSLYCSVGVYGEPECAFCWERI